MVLHICDRYLYIGVLVNFNTSLKLLDIYIRTQRRQYEGHMDIHSKSYNIFLGL